MNVPGNWKPCPIPAGTRKNKLIQVGQLRSMVDKRIGPRKTRNPPRTMGHFRRRDQVIRKPVEMPAVVAEMVGTRRRSPDEVADSRRTAW